jgi:endonuclease/exonuclease/phosphatase family metal-dependent hydrolase
MKKSWMVFLCLTLFSAATFAESSMKVMTWNVYMLPKPLKFSNQGNRIELILNKLKNLDHDIIVLEESFSRSFRKHMNEVLSEAYPYRLVLGKSGVFKQVMNSGVTVLSRWPLKVLDYDFYTTCAIADCFASKGFFLLEVTGPNNQIFHLGSTHMQSDSGASVFPGVRKNQLQQIKNLFDRHLQPLIPQVLIGDLNIDALAGTEFQEATDFLKMESTKLTGNIQTSKSHLVSCLGQKPSSNETWIDHVLSKANGSNLTVTDKKAFFIQDYVKGEWCDLSDHLPVEAILRF